MSNKLCSFELSTQRILKNSYILKYIKIEIENCFITNRKNYIKNKKNIIFIFQ